MEKTQTGAELPQVMIEGYKVTVRVTDKPLKITEVLDDLLGRQLEKIWVFSGHDFRNDVK